MTMPGILGAYTRERVRGARFLEMFACENFMPPPADVHFAPYTNDPAAGGPCMACHVRIDPASIHFKRFIADGPVFPLYGAGNAHTPDFGLNDRRRRLWPAGILMAPVNAATAEANPESLFIDFLPPDQTLYGHVSDGTVGPLGLAHLLIESGRFDRCAVRRIHEQIVGRDIDPRTESGYLEALVAEFISGNRAVKPFIRHLLESETFGRGQ
jgi:hypothetical protein